MAFLEGEDFYYDDEGLMVLTASYLKKRGHCCHSDCRHCPYLEATASDVPLELKIQDKDDPYARYIEMADEDQIKKDE